MTYYIMVFVIIILFIRSSVAVFIFYSVLLRLPHKDIFSMPSAFLGFAAHSPMTEDLFTGL